MTQDHRSDWSSESGAGGFIAGALSGLAVGLGLGLLLAPRSGAELRRSISESAGDLKQAASESYEQMSARVRETVQKSKDALGRGQEAWQQARDNVHTPTTVSNPMPSDTVIS